MWGAKKGFTTSGKIAWWFFKTYNICKNVDGSARRVEDKLA